MPAKATDILVTPCLRDLARWEERAPDAPTLLAPGTSAVSFAALTERIARVAQVLRRAGVKPGDIVAVALPEGPGFLTALLGTLEVAAAAPMNAQLTEAEFRSQLQLLPACLMLVRSANDGFGPAVALSLGIPVLELDSVPDAEFVLGPRRNCAPENVALVMQTSATTGEAKLVPCTHANLHAMCQTAQRGLAFHAEDRYLSIMPLHHILGFSSALGQLMAGGSVACTGFDAQRFTAWIEELNPTWYAAGPALHQAILDIAKQDPGPFRRSSLRFVRCGSGAGSPALLDDLATVLQVDVINGYGLTEVGPVTNTPPGLPRKRGSVGRAIGPEVAIVDAAGSVLPPDAEGEVVLRGAEVMEGYLGADDVNREVFRGGWFHTGDLGRMDPDGDLFITGRIKEVVNRGGETISPLEIDLVMAEHPAIARAAIFSVPHPTLGEDIVAAVVLRPGVSASASQLRSFLAARLSRSKVPGRIWFADSIPVSASGKPLRNVIGTMFQARAAESPESPAPPDDSIASVRQRIGEIWRLVLNSGLPAAEDNFFAMGGDSLSAARLFALLEAEFQLEESALDPAKFLDSPTFSQLTEIVSQGAPVEMRLEGVSAVCLRPAGVAPALFFFPGDHLDVWYLRHLVRALGDQRPFFALRHQIGDAAEFPDIAAKFVTLISRIQPDGPIVLAGHCYGGILAYEVAQRMIAAARPGVSVVLVDVATPGYPKPRASRYLRYFPVALGAVLRGEGPRLAREFAEHVRFLRALRHQEQKAERDLAPVPSGTPQNGHLQNPPPVQGGLSPAGVVLRSYAPRPFPGPLVNVLAGGFHASERVLEDARKGWRHFAQGPFREGSVPGEHSTCFDAQNAPLLADFIRASLPNPPATSGLAVP